MRKDGTIGTRLMLLAALLLPFSALATEPIKKRGPDISIADAARQPSRPGERDRLVREIRLQGLGRDDLRQDLTRGGFDKPRVIDSERELGQVFKDQAVQNRLEREVDFKQQKLLLFAWSGSRGDQLDHKVAGPEVVFMFKPGVTKDRDIRSRFELFALDKDTPYHVEKTGASVRDKEHDRLDRAQRSDRLDNPRDERRPGGQRQY